MTKEDAREKAERKVYCYMCKGDIDDAFDSNNLTVTGKNGRKKTKPTREEKEAALIEYYAATWTTEGEAEDSVGESEEKFRNIVTSILA